MADISVTAAFDAIPLLEDSDWIQGRQQGDSVANGQLETANKQAYHLANNIEALKTGKISGARNSVLSGASTAGVPTFGTFSSKVLTIAGDVTPLVLNFAQGVTAFGLKETVVSYTGSATIDYTAASGQHVVFAVLDGSTISFVSIALTSDMPWHVQPSAPSIFGDQFYFNTSDQKAYREVTGSFVQVNAILLGGVSLSGPTGTFLAKPYATPVFSHDAPCGAISKWHASVPAPAGWSLCAGASLDIAKYLELYNVIGTTYGGSGFVFTLPTITDSIIKLF